MHYSSYHVYPHLAIYFGSPFSCYPTFHTLTSVGLKKLYAKRIFTLFCAIVKFCSTNRLFSCTSAMILLEICTFTKYLSKKWGCTIPTPPGRYAPKYLQNNQTKNAIKYRINFECIRFNVGFPIQICGQLETK